MTLHDLLQQRHDELLARWTNLVRATLQVEDVSAVELMDRMPAFLETLVRALRPGTAPLPTAGAPDAGEHGQQRFRLGFDVTEVVKEYGALHASILALAMDHGVAVTAREGQILTKQLTEGSADAVSQYMEQRDAQTERQAGEHLGFLAHELRNPLHGARLALDVLQRRSQLAPTDPVVGRLERSLTRLADLIDSSLANAWLKAGVSPRRERLRLRALLVELHEDAATDAEARGLTLVLDADELELDADPRLLRSAIGNLLGNGLKFSRVGGTVTVRAQRRDGQVVIEVEDACGGLPPGRLEDLFRPFVQKGADRSGFGLGLAIVRQAVEAHRGTLDVRNVPGTGCVFVLRLPLGG